MTVYNMTRRTLLHQRFYAEPTKSNLEELVRSLESAVIEHIMTRRESDYIVDRAIEYYQEMYDHGKGI